MGIETRQGNLVHQELEHVESAGSRSEYHEWLGHRLRSHELKELSYLGPTSDSRCSTTDDGRTFLRACETKCFIM